eukprot:SM000107S14102  [mRNA]  locus=s107:326196:326910:- [translate_table: standard]
MMRAFHTKRSRSRSEHHGRPLRGGRRRAPSRHTSSTCGGSAETCASGAPARRSACRKAGAGARRGATAGGCHKRCTAYAEGIAGTPDFAGGWTGIQLHRRFLNSSKEHCRSPSEACERGEFG